MNRKQKTKKIRDFYGFENFVFKRFSNKIFRLHFFTHKKMKKAQIVGQIFIYLMGIIIAGFILLYGYKVIQGFRERTDQAVFIKFESDLLTEVKNSREYGSVNRETFPLSENFNEVCFLDLDAFLHTGVEKYPLIENSLQSKVKKNVFLISGDENVENSLYVGKIDVEQGFLCLPTVGGRLNIEFEGKGRSTFIRGYT